MLSCAAFGGAGLQLLPHGSAVRLCVVAPPGLHPAGHLFATIEDEEAPLFASRDRLDGSAGRVDLVFTDRFGGVSPEPYDSLDLTFPAPGRGVDYDANLAAVAAALDVPVIRVMRQVHGADVAVVDGADDPAPDADALVTTTPDVALLVRVADCAPVLLADPDAGVVAAAHAGRSGLVGGVVPAVVSAMRRQGARDIQAFVGPYVCGGCYEVPAAMQAVVESAVPGTATITRWGTAAVDIGVGVRLQLESSGCVVYDRSRCTLESGELYSFRRDGARSGRQGGVVVLRGSHG